jgi:hypothetical protein
MHTPAALPPRKAPFDIYWIGGLLDPKVGLDAAEKRDLILKTAGIQLHLLVLFFVGLSPYLIPSSTTAFPRRIVLINFHDWRTPFPHPSLRKTLSTHCQVPAFVHSTASCVLIHHIGIEDMWNKCDAIVIIPTNEWMNECWLLQNLLTSFASTCETWRTSACQSRLCLLYFCSWYFFPSLSFPLSSFLFSFNISFYVCFLVHFLSSVFLHVYLPILHFPLLFLVSTFFLSLSCFHSSWFLVSPSHFCVHL